MSGRDSIARGHVIELTVCFYQGGYPKDPTDLKFSVYPPGFDPRTPGVTTADAWVYDVTLIDGGNGPYATPGWYIIKTGTGCYKYTFRVPAGSALGQAFDRWEGQMDGVPFDEVLSFVVLEDLDTKTEPVGAVIVKGNVAYPVSTGGETTYIAMGSPSVSLIPTYEGVSLDFYENCGGNYFLPSGSFLTIPFSSITSASVVYICSSKECKVFINNSSDFCTLKDNGFFVLYNTEIYAILIESNSIEDADVSVLLFGE